MADDARSRTPVTRATLAATGLSLAAVVGLMQVASISDLLSDVTRPLVVSLLHLAGIAAADLQGSLVVGRLQIPWTRDCAGLNILGILWAVTLWSYRSRPCSGVALRRLALAVPAATAANVARILTLIAYRAISFPAVESPQLHYFFGFLWLMPVLGLFTPAGQGQEHGAPSRLEVLHLAAVLALLAPLSSAVGGTVVTVAALVVLLQSRLQRPAGIAVSGVAGAWLAAGLLVAAGRMESLWIPWLLACPWFFSPALARSPGGWMVLLGTLPLVAMHPVGGALTLAAAGWELLRLWGRAGTSPAGLVPSAQPRRLPGSAQAAVAGLVLFPFLAAAAAAQTQAPLRPSPGVMSQVLDPTSFRVRLVGQPVDLTLDWYGPFGDGRHHTLPVCMRYRGVELRETPTTDVLTDGTFWMREFFLVDGELLRDYPAYLRHTFAPFSTPGVHVIASAPVRVMTAASFAGLADQWARALQQAGTEHEPQALARRER